MELASDRERSRREWLGVAIMTAIGLTLRLWPVGGLGLTHFDEGIYALVSSWSLLPKGLPGLDPSLIPYAPPGYPILGGLAYVVLGRSDGAMIAVSQLAGTATIPVVARLTRRTFGPGAGFAAATFCAFSGPHIAFSRMALTDASFLLAWLLAIGAGMRFLERPGAIRGFVLGVAVGLAQQFKYNGWLAGGIVIGSAIWGILVRPEERKASSILRTFGWGGMAAGVAWQVVWPWYSFVEGHGGYSALLRHQQSYLGGFRDWPRHFTIQAAQVVALSGGWTLTIPAVGLAFLGSTLGTGRAWTRAFGSSSTGGRLLVVAGLVPAACLFVEPPYLLGLLILPWLLGLRADRMARDLGPTPRGAITVGVWWLVLTFLTPFYHPYARLWLPYEACHWMLMGWLVAVGLPTIPGRLREGFEASSRPRRVRMVQIWWWITFLLGLTIGLATWLAIKQSAQIEPGLFARSDSLYQATIEVSAVLPDQVKGLRLLARPPVTYYLAGRVDLYPMAGSDSLLTPGDPRIWALVDSAVLRSESGPISIGSGRHPLDRFADHWEVVQEFPTNPSLPTLLDLDPGLARPSSADRSYPLWLLRPRTAKGR
jgi:dolichyl-phosphate-mannose-protein mannosyltransferase